MFFLDKGHPNLIVGIDTVVKTFINIIASKHYKYMPWMKEHQHWCHGQNRKNHLNCF